MERIALARRRSSEKTMAAEKATKAKKWDKAISTIEASQFRKERVRASAASSVVNSGKIPSNWPGPLRDDLSLIHI